MSDLFAPSPEPVASPAVESTPAAAPVVEESLGVAMDKTLSDAYKAIENDEAPEGTEGAAAPAKPAAGATGTAGPARDANGKFVGKDSAGMAAPGQGQPNDAAQPTSDGKGSEQGAVDLTRPPSSFTPAAKAEWETLPETTRQEIYKREQDFHRGIQQYQARAQVGDLLYSEVAPYEGLIRAAGTDVPGALRSVLSTAATLQSGTPQQKVQAWLGIARDYGVDPRVAFAQQQGAPQVSPEVAELQRRLAFFEKQQGVAMSQLQQHENAQALSVIQEFGSNPAHKYFADVAPMMGTIIDHYTRQNQSITMQEAYDQACNASPAVRAALANEGEAKARAEAASKAKLGRQTLNPSPVPGTVMQPGGNDLDATLRARFREITAAS